MNAVSLDQTERIWLNAYLPGVPSDIDAGIEDYPSLREVFLEHLHKYRDRVAYVSIGTEMTYATWQAQGIAFAAWLQAQGVRKEAGYQRAAQKRRRQLAESGNRKSTFRHTHSVPVELYHGKIKQTGDKNYWNDPKNLNRHKSSEVSP